MEFAITFRRDGVTHVVLTTRERLRRRDNPITLCALRVDDTYMRIAPHSEPGRGGPINCERCTSSLAGYLDCVTTDFGFTPGDRYT